MNKKICISIWSILLSVFSYSQIVYESSAKKLIEFGWNSCNATAAFQSVAKRNRINICGFTKGMYYIKVNFNDCIRVQKIIKL